MVPYGYVSSFWFCLVLFGYLRFLLVFFSSLGFFLVLFGSFDSFLLFLGPACMTHSQ